MKEAWNIFFKPTANYIIIKKEKSVKTIENYIQVISRDSELIAYLEREGFLEKTETENES